MKLTYIYHSGYCIEQDGTYIIIDFYRDTDNNNGFVKKVLQKAKKLYVLSTHSHHDHFAKEILEWKDRVKDITYIFSKDILDEGLAKKEDATYLDKLDVYQDDIIKIKAYGSTDLGVSYYIEFAGKKIFHAGDLNNWHWNEEGDAAYVKEAEDFWHRELASVTADINLLDLAMFPIDPRLGKDYMRGAEEFIGAINVDMLVPMHFAEAYDKLEAFTSIASKHGCNYTPWTKKGESIELK